MGAAVTEGTSTPADAPPWGGQPTSAPKASTDTLRIVGRVLDRESGEGVQGAVVRVQSSDLFRITGRDGDFALPAMEPGTYVLVFDHLGYEPARDTVRLEPGDGDRRVEARLQDRPLELEAVEVQGRVYVPETGILRGAYERAQRMERLGLGRRIMRDEIDQWGFGRVTDLLHGIPGVYVQQAGAGRRSVLMRGARTGRACSGPVVYLDGTRFMRSDDWGDMSPDEFISARELEMVEVYRGAAEIPGEYSGPDAQCGVLVLWTRRGHDAGEGSTPGGDGGRGVGGLLGLGGFLGLVAFLNWFARR